MLRKVFFSLCAGILAGTSASVFLGLLGLASQWRESHPYLIWFLPVCGVSIGWAYWAFGRQVAPGSALILAEVHAPQSITPARMAPFVLFSTVATHLVGGSAGREGAAVQISASLADQLGRFFRLQKQERRALLIAGAGAGFGAAIGAPLAGLVFGMEFIHIGRLRWNAVMESAIASSVAFLTMHFLGVQHVHYPPVATHWNDFRLFLAVGLLGIVCGLGAQGFSVVIHWMERAWNGVKFPPLKPFLGGILLLALFQIPGTLRYAGLGIPHILEALRTPASVWDPVLKTFFSALTLSSGFKGGEFTPLVFIGATLGSALAPIFGVSLPVLASVGFAAVFAGASNTPFACSVMAAELFGWEIAPYAILGCLLSYVFSGPQGIYTGQKDRTRTQGRYLKSF